MQGAANVRWQDRDYDKERQEKLRQYPYHMHLNLDMLESVHLVCAMLLEVPNMASAAFHRLCFTHTQSVLGGGTRRRVINKQFRRQLEYHSRQAFNGPPENTRESVMAATKALQKGDWRKCCEHLGRLRMWDLMPKSDIIRDMFYKQVLRCVCLVAQ